MAHSRFCGVRLPGRHDVSFATREPRTAISRPSPPPAPQAHRTALRGLRRRTVVANGRWLRASARTPSYVRSPSLLGAVSAARAARRPLRDPSRAFDAFEGARVSPARRTGLTQAATDTRVSLALAAGVTRQLYRPMALRRRLWEGCVAQLRASARKRWAVEGT
ncbi:hypothetical protein MRX96_006511 [Rhipicephalus microplus]